MALGLMNVRQLAVLNLLSVALERVAQSWSQIVSSKMMRAARNQIGLTSQLLNPSFAVVAGLRRRFANVAGLYAVFVLIMGLPPSNMSTSAVPAAGVGAVLGHLTTSNESGHASIPANPPAARAKI